MQKIKNDNVANASFSITKYVDKNTFKKFLISQLFILNFKRSTIYLINLESNKKLMLYFFIIFFALFYFSAV